MLYSGNITHETQIEHEFALFSYLGIILWRTMGYPFEKGECFTIVVMASGRVVQTGVTGLESC